MDITQIILVAVISILTLLLLFVGFQVFLFLRELRQTLRKANRIVDEIGFYTVSEVLKLAFSSKKAFTARGAGRPQKKASTKVKKHESSNTLEAINGSNGETDEKHEFEKPFGFALKTPPRFFRGVPPKRR